MSWVIVLEDPGSRAKDIGVIRLKIRVILDSISQKTVLSQKRRYNLRLANFLQESIVKLLLE